MLREPIPSRTERKLSRAETSAIRPTPPRFCIHSAAHLRKEAPFQAARFALPTENRRAGFATCGEGIELLNCENLGPAAYNEPRP